MRFYENNGAPYHTYPTPNNGFFDSGWFSVGVTPRSTLTFTAGDELPSGGVFIPVDEMTWSVQFRGMEADDSVGLDIYSPPVVGASYPDYWQNNGGWTLMTNGVPMNFAARMQAVVPEPSAVTLLILGGLSMLTLARRLRRND